ncbi:MAG: hypothetical protein A2X49_17080 [Lentisphaerae bacterium GWF2_52_8]|nr:MAG: hypothetical protein A2X49_17080 [Lentisphaerae bacterium GWF2_52_8]
MFQGIARFLNKHNYSLNERLFNWPLDRIPLEKPIFLLGVHEAGLEVLAHIFQRHPDIAFCRGNKNFWDSSENEMQMHLPSMPPELSLLNTPDGPRELERYWSYATDENIKDYRHEPKDANPELSLRFQHCLKKVIRAYAINPEHCHLVDKSHLYTIKMGFVHELLRENDPYFILMIRNPYAICPHVARLYCMRKGKGESLGYEEAVKRCAQHWRNSCCLAMADQTAVAHFTMLRAEDLIANPEETVRDLCAYAGLSYEPSMLPAQGQTHSILNSIKKGVWPPPQANPNAPYLKELDQLARIIVKRECEDMAALFGYTPEGP